MNNAERIDLSKTAADRIGQVANVVGWEVFGESLSLKLSLLIEMIDRISAAAKGPVLITEIIPGFDLVVANAQQIDPSVSFQQMKIDPRALTPIDPKSLSLLAEVLRSAFEGNGGAGLYESKDGSHYVMFASDRRAEALASMGVSPESVVASRTIH